MRASTRSHTGRRAARRVCHHDEASPDALRSARRAATGSGPLARCCMMLNTSIATVANTRMTAIRTMIIATSHLDLDHACRIQKKPRICITAHIMSMTCPAGSWKNVIM